MIRLFNCFWQAGQQGLITWRDGLKVALRGTIYMPCSASHMTIRFFWLIIHSTKPEWEIKPHDHRDGFGQSVVVFPRCVRSPWTLATLSLKLKKKKHLFLETRCARTISGEHYLQNAVRFMNVSRTMCGYFLVLFELGNYTLLMLYSLHWNCNQKLVWYLIRVFQYGYFQLR